MKNGMVLDQLTQLARCNSLHTMTFRPALDDDDISTATTPPSETAKVLPIKRSTFSKNTLIQLRKELTKSFAKKGLSTVEAKVKVSHIIKSLSDPVKAEKHLQMIQKLYKHQASKDVVICNEHGIEDDQVVCCAAELEAQNIHFNRSPAHVHHTDFDLFKTAIHAT